MDSTSKNQNYSVLTRPQIQIMMNTEIEKLSNMLSIPKPSATILLINHEWNLTKIFDFWVVNPEKLFEKVGLFTKKPPSESSSSSSSSSSSNPKFDYEFVCGICLESYPFDHTVSIADCGQHPFCSSCWRDYIGSCIETDGPNCLKMRCPAPSCFAAVDRGLIMSLVSNEEHKNKYDKYLVSSYIENNSDIIKWCPNPKGCEYIVRFFSDCITEQSRYESYDVHCFCSYTFCWNCSIESHRPVTCHNAARWLMEAYDESKSLRWIEAYTKPCPKCQRPIEKHEEGCTHMTCAPPCGFEFCWNCLVDWSEHGTTGCCDPYRCPVAELVENYRRLDIAQKAIERYRSYYEQWVTSQLSVDKAIVGLTSVENDQIKRITEIYTLNKSMLMFVTDAWSLVVQCRRVLKWSYVFGYYLSEHDTAKEQYLVFLRDIAESTLASHCEYVEEELNRFVEAATTVGPGQDLDELSSKMRTMRSITGNYFQGFVTRLENDLSELSTLSYGWDIEGNHWFCDRCTYANYWFDMECQMCYHN